MAMHRGWLTRFEPHRRWLAQAVLLAFALPALLGLMPSPGLSAASALDRDLKASLCAGFGSGVPGTDGEEQHLPPHENCILCAVCAGALGPVLAKGGSAFPGLAESTDAYPPVLTAKLRPDHFLLRSGSPPRGPPSILLV